MIRRLFTTISKKDFPKVALNNPEFNQHELNSWINKSHFNKINPKDNDDTTVNNDRSLISDDNIVFRCTRYTVYKDDFSN